MKFFWVDTETTGIDHVDSGAFQIAYIFRNKDITEEKVLYLNPLDDNIIYHKEAGLIHGIPEEEIRSYPSASIVIPELVEKLKELVATDDGKKLYIAGYNVIFDYMHLKSLIEKYTESKMDEFFYPQMADVFSQAKKGKLMGRVNTVNLKLTTVCKSFNVKLDNAHNALADITATRDLAIQLQKRGIPLL